MPYYAARTKTLEFVRIHTFYDNKQKYTKFLKFTLGQIYWQYDEISGNITIFYIHNKTNFMTMNDILEYFITDNV